MYPDGLLSGLFVMVQIGFTFNRDSPSNAANVISERVCNMQVSLYERLYEQQNYGRPER
jgi:hypothetical protein